MVCTVAVPCTVANTTSIADLFINANNNTQGFFGMGLIFVVFTISYIGMSAYPPKQSLPASAFLSFVASIFLREVGLVSDFVVIIIMIITAAATLFLTMSKEF